MGWGWCSATCLHGDLRPVAQPDALDAPAVLCYWNVHCSCQYTTRASNFAKTPITYYENARSLPPSLRARSRPHDDHSQGLGECPCGRSLPTAWTRRSLPSHAAQRRAACQSPGRYRLQTRSLVYDTRRDKQTQTQTARDGRNSQGYMEEHERIGLRKAS